MSLGFPISVAGPTLPVAVCGRGGQSLLSVVGGNPRWWLSLCCSRGLLLRSGYI